MNAAKSYNSVPSFIVNKPKHSISIRDPTQKFQHSQNNCRKVCTLLKAL